MATMNKAPVHKSLLVVAIVSGFAGNAFATDVRGQLILGAYRPEEEKQTGKARFNFELENGFKEVLSDRVEAARELAVVLTGEGEPSLGERQEVLFSGGGLMPATVVIRQGSTIYLRNEDEVAHELLAQGLDGFSAEATSPKAARSINLKSAGNWPLRDTLVTHLRGHLHVVADLIAVAKVAPNGKYVFEGINPGSYTLRVFHGPNEIASQQVEVGARALSVDPITLTAAPAKDNK